MELQYLHLETGDCLNQNSSPVLSKCGEIFIVNNPPVVAFNLVCCYCEIECEAFDDFRIHFLNEHYDVEENNLKVTRLKPSTIIDVGSNVLQSNVSLEENDGSVPDDSMSLQQDATKQFESEFTDLFDGDMMKDTSGDTSDSSSSSSDNLEPEIDCDVASLVSNNYIEEDCSSLDTDTEFTGPISLSVNEAETTDNKSHPANSIKSVVTTAQYNKKQTQSSTCSSSLSNIPEKTIEIYKEVYVPEKPKFVLAAVNLPVRTSDDEDCRGDPAAFPQNENADTQSSVAEDDECKPKFKFNNLKFRRQHNEKYYLSIEKTLNETDGLFYCPECSKRYKRIESLRYHYLSHTGVPAPFQCSLCKKGFPSAYKVRIHFTKHTGERPFRCNLCPRVYRHKQQLKFHLEAHAESNACVDDLSPEKST